MGGNNRIAIIKVLFTIDSVLLLYLAILPAAVLPSTGLALPRVGDLEHYLAYLVWGGLLSFLALTRERKFKGLALVLLLGLNFTFVTELVQYLIPTRNFDFIDWGIDMLGVLTSSVILYFLRVRNAS